MAETTTDSARSLDTEKSYVPRDFRVESITLINSAGNLVDFRALILEIQIFQDLHLGYMHGEILVSDATDMLAHYGVHGNEYLYLDLYEPGNKTRLKKAFRVFKVSHRRRTSNNSQKYILNFVSDEMVQSQAKTISKSYKGRKISEIVRDLLVTELNVSEDRVDIEETSEPVDIIIPNFRPTEALNWLASRAFNGENLCYYFYENLDGFNFKSIQAMYDGGSVNSGGVLTFDNKSVAPNNAVSYNQTIDNLDGKRHFDTLLATAAGAYAIRYIGLDPFYQKVTITDIGADQMPKLYDNPQVSNATDADGNKMFEKYDGYTLAYIQNDDTPTEKANKSEVWVKRVMASALLHNGLTEISFPGNMSVQVGKLLSVNLSKMVSSITGEDMKNEYLSGDYLVTSVNHKFDVINGLFTTTCMISRDSSPVPYPEPDSNLADKIVKINS